MTCVWTVFDSWMEERDPDFVPKAVEIIELELHPPTSWRGAPDSSARTES